MDIKKLKPLEELLDSVRDIEGFPIGKDEDILNLSNAPYYTACPNPYINDFIDAYGKPYDPATDTYERKPFVGDVNETKFNPIYRAHSYHTKVPHTAIMKYINHYTDEGDIVLDGFSGSGMTGIAAQLTKRNAILSDISPIASFISNNYNNIEADKLEKEAEKIFDLINSEYDWLYKTKHIVNTDTRQSIFEENGYGRIDYIIWSQVFSCPYCKEEYKFWDWGVNKKTEKTLKDYECKCCGSIINKRNSKKIFINFFDSSLNENYKLTKYEPALISYTYNGTRYRKIPDEYDLLLIKKIDDYEIPYWYPSNLIKVGVNTKQPINSNGYKTIHNFYQKRQLIVHSALNHLIEKNITKYAHTSILGFRCTNRMPYRPGGASAGSVNNLSIPSLIEEYNVLDTFMRKVKDIINAQNSMISNANVLVSTNSVTDLKLVKSNSIDYIFTDPPFGSNIMYSELNFIIESWLKVMSNFREEAIVNEIQNKDIYE